MNDKVPELWLRPHHLLCLQSFAGHGYSEEFVQQMSVVKQQLTNSPDTPVKIVRGADMLCRHCPNCKIGTCTSDKPDIFDQLVLNILNRGPLYRTVDGLSATPDPTEQDISYDLSATPDPTVYGISHDLSATPDPTVYGISYDLSATPELTVYGIPESLTMSQELIETCCPGCEWEYLCRRIIGEH